MKQSTENIIVFTLNGILFAFAAVYCYSFYQFDGGPGIFYMSMIWGLGAVASVLAIIEELINPKN